MTTNDTSGKGWSFCPIALEKSAGIILHNCPVVWEGEGVTGRCLARCPRSPAGGGGGSACQRGSPQVRPSHGAAATRQCAGKWDTRRAFPSLPSNCQRCEKTSKDVLLNIILRKVEQRVGHRSSQQRGQGTGRVQMGRNEVSAFSREAARSPPSQGPGGAGRCLLGSPITAPVARALGCQSQCHF